MYKCLNCGEMFEEASYERELIGEYEGQDAYQEFGYCPCCGSDDCEETEPCALCGEEHLPDELISGVCEHCIDEYRDNLDMCDRICGDEKESIKISSLLTSIYTPEQIEDILFKTLENETDCSEFVDTDISWFAERLTEEVKKIENSRRK